MGAAAELTLQSIHTNFVQLTQRVPISESRTFLRPCSARWLEYHEHGFDSFVG